MHLCLLWGLLVVLNQNTWHNKCHQSDYYTHNMEINVYWKEVSKKRAFSLYYDDMSYYFDIITYVQENPKWINPANPLCPTEHHSCFYLPVMVLPVCSLTFPSLYHHVSDAPRHDPRFTLVSKDYQARQRTSAVHGWWWFAPDKWAIACWASLTCRLRVLTVQLDLQPRHRSGSVKRVGAPTAGRRREVSGRSYANKPIIEGYWALPVNLRLSSRHSWSRSSHFNDKVTRSISGKCFSF